MRIKSSNYKLYITAAILAALLQGAVCPISPALAADPIQDSSSSSAGQTAETGRNELTEEEQAEQERLQKKARYEKAMEGRVDADHSAEFKPIVNEYLKEGEGVPGNEVPYYGNVHYSPQERKEMRALYIKNKHLRLERQKFLKKRAKEKRIKARTIAESLKNRQEYSIVFDPSDYTAKTMNADGTDVAFRAYEHLVYVKKPYNAESQMLSIYIPEAYFNNGTINGFTAETAPIFLPNAVGGYMPGEITEPSEESRHGGANSVLYALSNGYVVVSPAIRGRTLQAENGYYTGKAPALIVDYKAAVRYVRKNRKAGLIPAGDTEKIISSGTSAGGALSALLGATGNAPEYEPYLKAIGAAKERDDIFAAMAYCPITNLENADMAYEWMFNGENTYYARAMGGKMPSARQTGKPAASRGLNQPETQPSAAISGRPANAPAEAQTGTALTEKQKEASLRLKNAFPEYLNSLNLRDSLGGRLNLAPDGDGIFKEYIESLYLAAAQEALDTGEDLSKTDWLTIDQGEAIHMDFTKYKKAVKRLKGVPAFDSFANTSGENNEFGTEEIDNRHFTRFSLENSTVITVPKEEEEKTLKKEKEALYRTASPMEKLQLEQADLLEQTEKDKLDLSEYMADPQIIRLMNPMSFIGQAGVDTAPNWRIRHGVLDRDTALAIPAILAVKLKNSGKTVDFKAAWGYGHDGDYDLPDLFAWADRISKIKDTSAEILKKK